MKPLCETTWGCRINSVKALRYQLPQVCDSLDDLTKVADYPKIKSEAESLYECLSQYKFIVSLVLWYDVLFQVNLVSKELQGETVDLSHATSCFSKLMTWLKELRAKGLNQVLVTVRELAEDMDVVPVFPPKRQRKRKTHHDESAEDFRPESPEDDYRINCFNQILDKAIQSLQPRFEQLEENNTLFNVLYNFKSLDYGEIKQCADKLQHASTPSARPVN